MSMQARDLNWLFQLKAFRFSLKSFSLNYEETKFHVNYILVGLKLFNIINITLHFKQC